MTSAAIKTARHFVLATATIAGAITLPMSQAAAIDFLRGSVSSYSKWDGGYFGVTGNASAAHANFSQGAGDLVAFILRNTTMENEGHVSTWSTSAPADTRGQGFGAFFGWNYQIDPTLILGWEVAYTKFNRDLSMASSDAMTRVFDESTGYTATVSLATDVSLRIKDYGTFRARAGYVMGQFLPYAFVGLAVGRVTVSRSATVTTQEVDNTGGGRPTLNSGPTTMADITNKVAYGFATGLGTEVTILPNVFLRAEYEYVQFAPISGTRAYMHTGRVGVGVKF
ncbi:MAG: porin family protein [Pseudolabrys sp.]|nr:porin family protein [Pseudolabrys sp.]